MQKWTQHGAKMVQQLIKTRHKNLIEKNIKILMKNVPKLMQILIQNDSKKVPKNVIAPNPLCGGETALLNVNFD